MSRRDSDTPLGYRDRWRTPCRRTNPAAAPVFEIAETFFGGFDLDAAAEAGNALCSAWLGPGGGSFSDGLSFGWRTATPWPTRVWCNPPYSSPNLKLWTAKAVQEADRGANIVMLVPLDPNGWFVENVVPHAMVHILYPRINFLYPDGSLSKGAPAATCLVQYTGSVKPRMTGFRVINWREWRP